MRLCDVYLSTVRGLHRSSQTAAVVARKSHLGHCGQPELRTRRRTVGEQRGSCRGGRSGGMLRACDRCACCECPRHYATAFAKCPLIIIRVTAEVGHRNVLPLICGGRGSKSINSFEENRLYALRTTQVILEGCFHNF